MHPMDVKLLAICVMGHKRKKLFKHDLSEDKTKKR